MIRLALNTVMVLVVRSALSKQISGIIYGELIDDNEESLAGVNLALTG